MSVNGMEEEGCWNFIESEVAKLIEGKEMAELGEIGYELN